MSDDTQPVEALPPCLLIASPQMRDPFFEKTLVLLCHHDADGAFGVVINRPLDQLLPEALVALEDVDMSAYADDAVGWGGPVEPGSGTVVSLAEVPEDEGWNVPGGLSVTRSLDQLLRLMKERQQLFLCLGYAGWGPGQLDGELQRGGWLWTDPDPALVFEVPADQRYDRALATLGLTSRSVWMQPVDE